jgi:hypothetical protein
VKRRAKIIVEFCIFVDKSAISIVVYMILTTQLEINLVNKNQCERT